MIVSRIEAESVPYDENPGNSRHASRSAQNLCFNDHVIDLVEVECSLLTG